MTDLTRPPAPPPPQMSDETDGDYRVFVAWFSTFPRPTPLSVGCAELAASNSWAARAQAWEWQQRLRLAERSPSELLRELVVDQVLTGRIAAAKILDGEAGSKTLTAGGEATLDRLSKLAELNRALPAPPAEEGIDWTKLTQEERAQVLEAMALVRKASGSGSANGGR